MWLPPRDVCLAVADTPAKPAPLQGASARTSRAQVPEITHSACQGRTQGASLLPW